jgi:hypothetical protein
MDDSRMGEFGLFFQSPARGNDHGGRDGLDGFARICWLQQRFKIKLTHNAIPNPAAAKIKAAGENQARLQKQLKFCFHVRILSS